MTTRRPLTADDLWALARIGSPEPLPDGSAAVVPVTTYDLEENRGRTRLWLVADDGDRPLTAPEADSTAPQVSPDGARLAFLRKVDDRAQVHVMDLGGGEAERLTDLPLGAWGLRWLPDGSGLVVLVPVYRDATDLEAARTRRDELAERPVKAHTSEARFYRFWDMWLTDGVVPHLFRLDVASRELEDLTPDELRWWSWPNVGNPGDDFDISPDGTRIAFSAIMTDANEAPRSGVFVVPTSGGTPELITPVETGSAMRPRWASDDTLVYGRTFDHTFYADRVRLVRHRLGEEPILLTADWDRSAAAWQIDGDRIVLQAEDLGRVAWFETPVDRPGIPTELARSGSLTSPMPSPTGIWGRRESLSHPPEVVRLDEDGIHPLGGFNRTLLEGIEMAEVDERWFTGADGDDVQMFVLRPRDAEGPLPLVHMIHGGPHGMFGDQWHWRWSAQAFAAPGHLVALVNFHGSTSYGQAFAESIVGEWGDKPTVDVEAATDLLVAEGLADPERMAISGGSYGGYLTAWLMTQTDRYACAVAHAAVTNLAGMYASDYVFHRARAYGAEYWEDPERVDRWSPVAHAAGYATPCLVIHGEKDYRVPVTQGLELYGILRAKGIEARLVYYPDENHWILKPQNSLHWYGEVLGWFERYLG